MTTYPVRGQQAPSYWDEQLREWVEELPITPGPFQDNLSASYAGKPVLATDPVQYVSAGGDDDADGLSWGSAKLTLEAAVAALPDVDGVKAGNIFVGVGTFILTETIDVTQKMSIFGVSSPLTRVQCNLDGDHFRVKASPFEATQAGRLQGMNITSNGSANGVGVHIGDIIGFTFQDVVIQSFTGANGVGLWMDNVTHFTERTSALGLHLNGNTTNLKFSINGGLESFGYGKWMDLRINTEQDQVGISVEDNALVYSNFFDLNVNVSGTTGNDAVVINVGPSSFFLENSFRAFMEETTGTGATAIRVEPGGTFTYRGLIQRSLMAVDLDGVQAISGGVHNSSVATPRALTLDACVAGLTDTPLIHQVILDADVTSTTISNPVQGQWMTIEWLISTAGVEYAWPANCYFKDGRPPSPSTAVGSRDMVTFWCDGASWFEVARSPGVSTTPAVLAETNLRTSGNFAFTSTSWLALDSAALDCVVDARVGDVLDISVSLLWSTEAVAGFLDVVTVVAGSIVNYVSGSGSSGDGLAAWQAAPGLLVGSGGSAQYEVTPGDLDNGQVRLRLMGKVSSVAGRAIYADTGTPIRVSVRNTRQ